ncbi:macro domain-containing protein [uncultured Dubosiella sp.]|uniref:macro domain-containing protein n=1 Tax=uncultured Dubosiella sp. TaxID=1937011 RepID=UPI000EF085BB|nr:macro domain-containing protein [uncultured Dubosiella sp.]HAM30791.1 phosphatase [Erysipelotrichaceae bacterium]
MISTIKGDITGLDFDVIVNAANAHFARGGGVCGAIFAKAGPELDAFCAKLPKGKAGDVRISPAFGLPSKAILHAVGPIYEGTKENAQALAGCYWNCVAMAYQYKREHDLERLSLAFPCISTGIYGYPHEAACDIAVRTIRKIRSAFPDTKSIDIIFVCYEQIDYELYKKALREL